MTFDNRRSVLTSYSPCTCQTSARIYVSYRIIQLLGDVLLTASRKIPQVLQLTCFLYFRSKSSRRIPRCVSKYDPVISVPTSQSIRATVAASFFLGQGLFSVLLRLRSFWQTSLWRDLRLRQINNADVRSQCGSVAY